MHVTGDVIVPAGHTLNIMPGTLVIIDGNDTPQSTTGRDIEVSGRVVASGTAASPITFTASSGSHFWGELRHLNSQPSTYQHVEFTRAGHSPRGGHTNTGPAIRPTNSTLNFDYVAITDTAGKTMTGDGATLNMNHTHFARSVMGPEVDDTAVLMQNSNIHEMLGIYQENGGAPDDNDGFYIHSQLAGQTVRFSNTVFARGDDDGIDTLAAGITVEDCIVRDFSGGGDPDSKGISLLGAESFIRRTLIVNNNIGISAKVQTQPSAFVHLDHVTIADANIGIEANDKYNQPNALISFDIKNSIIQASQLVRTDYPPQQIVIAYSNLSSTWPGTGNSTAVPQFKDPAAIDFHLKFGSSAIDTGDPASPLDTDGTRTDMGYAPFQHGRVSGRHVFYNQSAFDGNDAAANAADDGSIAPDKQPLLPGGTATFANYTSYSRGLNGLMVDVADLAGAPTTDDFEFRIGNNDAPTAWPLLATAPTVSVRSAPSGTNVSRISLVWPEFSLRGFWLQVTLKATSNTALASPDVFYFGNAVGESGNSSIDARVTSTDEIFARNSPRSLGNPAPITFPYDFNRDERVGAVDQIIARNSRTTFQTTLNLIRVPLASQSLQDQAQVDDEIAAKASFSAAEDMPRTDQQQLGLGQAVERGHAEMSSILAQTAPEVAQPLIPVETLFDIARRRQRATASPAPSELQAVADR